VDPFSKPKVTAIVLAAGAARRMGRSKQTLDTGGVPMLRRTVGAVADARLDDVFVVLPPVDAPGAASMLDAVADLPVRSVHNPAPARGLLSSLKEGLRALAPGLPTDGVMVTLGDLPLVTPATYGELARAFREARGQMIVRPAYAGLPGHPVTFPRAFAPEVLDRPDADQGAAFLLQRHPADVLTVDLETDSVVFDVDTPQDLRVLAARLGASAGAS
jgi:molybdenum cofactor cytidylyltransferase